MPFSDEDTILLIREAARIHPQFTDDTPDPDGDELAVFKRLINLVETHIMMSLLISAITQNAEPQPLND